MQSIHPSPVQTKQLSNARPQSELHLMLVCIKALANLSNQLHQRLEGEVILIGDIPKLNIPLKYFLVEPLHKDQKRQPKTITPLIHCFWSGVDSFLHLPSCRIWKARKRRFKSWKPKISTIKMSYQIFASGLLKSIRHWVPSILNELN